MRNSPFLSGILALYIILGCWKGYVALFEKDKDEPMQIFPCRVESLPEPDRAALAKGIIVRNRRDLDQLLEDFLS